MPARRATPSATAKARKNSSARLGPIVNAIVLYDTIYTQRSLDHLAATGMRVDDVDVERLSPLGTDHIGLTGRYASRSPTPYATAAATPSST